MAQQPLTGRGLSQTILQPTDILGEAQARQQQEQVLAARQQAAQKPTKASRIDFDLEKAGDIYSGIYNEAYKQIAKFASDNAEKLDEDSFFYDKELRLKFDTTLAVVNSASSMMKNNDAIVREDFKDLSEDQKSTSGALNLLKNVAGLSKGVKVDFDNMDFGITGEDGSFESYDQIEYITNPRSSYYRRQTWLEDLEGKLDKTFIDENGVREAYKEKIDGQIDIYFNNLDNSPDYQYSVIADYLQDSNDGIGIPDARRNALGIIRRLVESEDGTYTFPNGEVITREEALDWGKNQVKKAWYNKHGLSVDTQKSGTGGSQEIIDGSLSIRGKTYLDDIDFFDVANPDAPLELRRETYFVYTPQAGKLDINVQTKEGQVVKADVVDLVDLGDGKLGVTYSYEPSRGVGKRGGLVVKKNDSVYESVKAGLGQDPIKMINENKENVESPIEGYSMQEVIDAARQANMSVDAYVNWYNENYNQ